jgi:hypothetical protein
MYSVASRYFDYVFADVEFFKKIWDLEQEHESQAKINLWQAHFSIPTVHKFIKTLLTA